ncbi:MAG: FecR family protein [Chitinophagaceae bacterium]
MQTLESRIRHLLEAYLDNRATPAEFSELMSLLQVEAGDNAMEEALQHRLEKAGIHPDAAGVNWERMVKQIMATPVAPVRRMIPWRRIAVAASLLVVVALAAYFLFSSNRMERQEQPVSRIEDIAPPSANLATLTLADGRTVYLDSAGNGLLAQQQDVAITRQADGVIRYASGETAAGQPVYNTLYNPRGSRIIQLTLGDGTRIWLNAESSLRYPASFTGDKREVEITGEAFFEVNTVAVAGKKMPFVVKQGELAVTVTGTRFNVNAYRDEQSIRVTLLEGGVNLALGDDKNEPALRLTKLVPGQQAQVSLTDRDIVVHSNVDLEKSTAWKENVFMFSGDDITAIMRQLARWYKVEVVYKNAGSGQHFTGIISRDNNISEVLKMLEATGKVSFDIEKDKVIVTL